MSRGYYLLLDNNDLFPVEFICIDDVDQWCTLFNQPGEPEHHWYTNNRHIVLKLSVTIWTATVRYFFFFYPYCVPPWLHSPLVLPCPPLSPFASLNLLLACDIPYDLTSQVTSLLRCLVHYIYLMTCSDSFPTCAWVSNYDTAQTSILVIQLPSMYLSWLSMESWALSLTWYSIQVSLL